MLALAARAMGYRIAVLDPDPDCPAAAVADRVVVGAYDDVGAALRLAERQRRRHLRAGARRGRRRRGGRGRSCRSGRAAARCVVTQDRLAERRFVEARRDRRRAVARGPDPGRRLRRRAPSARPPAPAQGRRSAATTAAARSGSPTPAELDGAWTRLGRPAGTRRSSPSASSTSRRSCRSSSPRGLDGADAPVPGRAQRPRRAGSSSSRSRRRRSRRTSPTGPPRSAAGLAAAMDLCGTLTVELFLLARRLARRQRARAARPQQRPLDDRGRRDLAVRAAHPGDLRARPRVDRRRSRPTAMVNLLGDGPRRAGAAASASATRSPIPTSTSTSTTSARVFERRKMGHVTALGADRRRGAGAGPGGRARAALGRRPPGGGDR